ncbi:MAG: glycerophosphodiester phosphodiesterase family protein [[Clostridium] scindens]
MVIHDEDLQRLADMPEKVENLTADQLQELTVISNGEKGKIPTFQEMVEAVKNTKDKTGLLVELKPTAENRDELVSKVIETVEKCNAKNQCIFMSLDYESVYQLQAEHPEWWIGYCIYGGVGKMEDAVWEYNIDFLAVEEGLASNKFMEKARNSGLAVYIWTSNNFDDMENYLEMGASGIITDLPDLARDTIDRYMKDHQEYYAYDGKGYPKKKN